MDTEYSPNPTFLKEKKDSNKMPGWIDRLKKKYEGFKGLFVADGSSKKETGNKASDPSRRRFMKHLAVTATAVSVGGMSIFEDKGKNLAPADKEEVSDGGDLKQESASSDPREIASIENVTKKEEILGEKGVEEFLFDRVKERSKADKVMGKIDQLYRRFKAEGRDKEAVRFEGEYGKQLKQAVRLVSESKVLGRYVTDEWVRLFKGLILAESNGRQEAVSVTGAVGLCQMFPEAAKDASTLLGIKKYDIKGSSQDNLTLGFGYLMNLVRIYKDPGMAIWAYNFGMGVLNEGLEYYLKNKLGVDVDKLAGEALKNNSFLAEYVVDRLNVSWIDLDNYTPMESYLKQNNRFAKIAYENHTKEYVARVVACAKVIDQLG